MPAGRRRAVAQIFGGDTVRLKRVCTFPTHVFIYSIDITVCKSDVPNEMKSNLSAYPEYSHDDKYTSTRARCDDYKHERTPSAPIQHAYTLY